jgi:hypothetical protein
MKFLTYRNNIFQLTKIDRQNKIIRKYEQKEI